MCCGGTTQPVAYSQHFARDRGLFAYWDFRNEEASFKHFPWQSLSRTPKQFVNSLDVYLWSHIWHC